MASTIFCQLFILLWLSVANADSASYVYGATPSAVGYAIAFGGPRNIYAVLGFDIRIFQYDFEDMSLGYDANFMASEYTSRTLEYSLTGVTDINFSGVIPDADASAPYEDTLFGETLEVSNFVAEFTTYFYPQQSGFFKFESINTDDSMMFFLGDTKAFVGCTKISTFDLSTFDASSYNMFTGTRNASVQSYYQYLQAGHLYPIRIIYVNMDSDYAMQLQITNPDGSVITDFDSKHFISPYALKSMIATCYTSTDTTTFETVNYSWTGTTTSYSTYYPTGSEDVTAYYYYPDPTTTVTAHYHGPTVSSNVVTPTGAGTWTESIFYPQETVSSYVPWTGATTATSTTVIPENAEVPATVVIEVPDAITTTTHLWTGIETSSSTIYPADGQNGTITVEILTPRDVITSTTFWTGNSAYTFTTIFPDNTNGTITVGVEIPKSTKTVTDFWSGSTTSYTTEHPSDFINEVIIHEYVPQSVISSGIVYVTTYWTGDFTSYSTVNPGYNNDTTTILVNIPQQTITETWSGTVTSTSFYCPFSGAASIPIVLVPSPTGAPSNCENCEPSIMGSSLISSVEIYVSSSGSSSTSVASNGAYVSSSGGSTESSGTTPDIGIEYSNSGKKLEFLNLIFAASILFSFYLII